MSAKGETDEIETEGRVTRAVRKRLSSIEREDSPLILKKGSASAKKALNAIPEKSDSDNESINSEISKVDKDEKEKLTETPSKPVRGRPRKVSISKEDLINSPRPARRVTRRNSNLDCDLNISEREISIVTRGRNSKTSTPTNENCDIFNIKPSKVLLSPIPQELEEKLSEKVSANNLNKNETLEINGKDLNKSDNKENEKQIANVDNRKSDQVENVIIDLDQLSKSDSVVEIACETSIEKQAQTDVSKVTLENTPKGNKQTETISKNLNESKNNKNEKSINEKCIVIELDQSTNSENISIKSIEKSVRTELELSNKNIILPEEEHIQLDSSNDQSVLDKDHPNEDNKKENVLSITIDNISQRSLSTSHDEVSTSRKVSFVDATPLKETETYPKTPFSKPRISADISSNNVEDDQKNKLSVGPLSFNTSDLSSSNLCQNSEDEIDENVNENSKENDTKDQDETNITINDASSTSNLDQKSENKIVQNVDAGMDVDQSNSTSDDKSESDIFPSKDVNISAKDPTNKNVDEDIRILTDNIKDTINDANNSLNTLPNITLSTVLSVENSVNHKTLTTHTSTPNPGNPKLSKLNSSTPIVNKEKEMLREKLFERDNYSGKRKSTSNFNEINELKQDSLFSKSWSQPVTGSAAGLKYIDGFGIKENESKVTNENVDQETSKTSIKQSEKEIEDDKENDEDNEENEDDKEDEEEDENEENADDVNEFIDNEAAEATDDSMDEEERQYLKENEIPEEGISIGSEDTEENGSDDESNDSFVVSDEEVELLDTSENEMEIENNEKLNVDTSENEENEKLDKNENVKSEQRKKVKQMGSKSFTAPTTKIEKKKNRSLNLTVTNRTFSIDDDSSSSEQIGEQNDEIEDGKKIDEISVNTSKLESRKSDNSEDNSSGDEEVEANAVEEVEANAVEEVEANAVEEVKETIAKVNKPTLEDIMLKCNLLMTEANEAKRQEKLKNQQIKHGKIERTKKKKELKLIARAKREATQAALELQIAEKKQRKHEKKMKAALGIDDNEREAAISHALKISQQILETKGNTNKTTTIDNSKVEKLKTISNEIEKSNKRKMQSNSDQADVSDVPMKRPKKLLKVLDTISDKKQPAKQREIKQSAKQSEMKQPAKQCEMKEVNGFKIELLPPTKPEGFKIHSQPITSKKDKSNKNKNKNTSKIVEPKTLLDKPQWTSAGEFVVSKMPKNRRIEQRQIVSTVTDFVVTSVKKGNVAITKASNFKETALYGSKIKRESSKELLHRKEKQKANLKF